MRSRIILMLLSLIISFAGFEIALRIFDPMGIEMRYNDISKLSGEISETGILNPEPGILYLTESTLSINEERQRVLPDTNNDALCTIAFIGDSVTFGWGVSDEETFANLIAKAKQDVRFINGAASAADNLQLVYLMERTEADGYIHLIWENDAQDIELRGTNRKVHIRWEDRLLYARWHLKSIYARQVNPPSPLSMEAFWSALSTMHRDDVLFFILENNPFLDQVIQRYPDTVVINWEYNWLSWADSHPDAEGHRTAARLMLPHVSTFVDRVCSS